MKKIAVFLCSLILALFAVACASQGDGVGAPSGQFTVTFIQDGQEAVKKTVYAGNSVTPPEIVATPPAGYSYEWERTDFSALSENITVRLKAVANVYTLYFDIGSDSYAQIASATQAVTFDSALVLPVPTRYGYTFVGWLKKGTNEPFAPEKYTVVGNTELVAKWAVDHDSDRWFTPDF